MSKVRFAAIGLNHFHIYGQIDLLLKAGAEFVAYHGEEEKFSTGPSPSIIRRPRRSTIPGASSRIQASPW